MTQQLSLNGTGKTTDAYSQYLTLTQGCGDVQLWDGSGSKMHSNSILSWHFWPYMGTEYKNRIEVVIVVVMVVALVVAVVVVMEVAAAAASVGG